MQASVLQAQLEALENGDHDPSLSQYEVERQKKILRNRIVLAGLGLDELKPSFALEQERQERKAKRVAAAEERQKWIQQRRKERGGDGEEDDGDDDDDYAESEEDEPARQRRSGRLTGKTYNFNSLSDVEEESMAKRDRPPPGSRKGRRGAGQRRQVGSRIYDPIHGTSCHQCRQKTMDPKVECTNQLERMLPDGSITREACTVKMDTQCLQNRYGETVDSEFVQSGKWKCPKCRGICNCSFCRRKKGLAPTGILAHVAEGHGYSGVAEYLAKRWGEGEKSFQEDPAVAGAAGEGLSADWKRSAPISRPRQSPAPSLRKTSLGRTKRHQQKPAVKEDDSQQEPKQQQQQQEQQDKENESVNANGEVPVVEIFIN